MRKALIILLVAVAAGYVLHDRLGRTQSEEEALVAGVRARYVEAVNMFLKAARYGAGLGLDNTADVDQSTSAVLKARAELARLREDLTEERAIARADKLAEEIETFCQKNDII